MFCFLSHVVEERYFDEIEVMFLIVGHTHNILDQWFSVLAKAIRNAHFIGSILAIQELYKIAHNEKQADFRPAMVHQMRFFRDYRRWYDPVRNDRIHNFNIPHRFKFSYDELLGVAVMRYMPFSPPHGLKTNEVWHPLPRDVATVTNTRTDGDIILTPLITFNGPEVVLAALGVVGETNQTDLAVGSQAERDKTADINYFMPILREIEVRALAEHSIRAVQEANTGISDEEIPLSVAMLKAIDAEISKKNAAKDGRGRIVWLKRSQLADDPSYLDRAPDILPNPRLWRERIANMPPPPPPPPVTALPNASNTATAQVPQAPPETPQQVAIRKKKTADGTEAQSRLVAFQNGAGDMATTATHMIKFMKASTAFEISPKIDIAEATSNFKKLVLTTREVLWYQSIDHGTKITATVEALVAAEEQKPWKLLNFPVLTDAQKSYMECIQQERAAKAASVEANLRRLLLRRGEGEYDPTLQVVNFDGFAPTETQDVDKMTRPTLDQIAKVYMKMTTSELKKLKVDQLRAKVKAYVEQHPEAVQLPSAAAILASAAGPASSSAPAEGSVELDAARAIDDSTAMPVPVPVPEPEPEPGAVSAHSEAPAPVPMDSETPAIAPSHSKCAVIACEETGVMFQCEECELGFCELLHRQHSSHSLHVCYPRPPDLRERLRMQQEYDELTSESSQAQATAGPLQESPSTEDPQELLSEVVEAWQPNFRIAGFKRLGTETLKPSAVLAIINGTDTLDMLDLTSSQSLDESLVATATNVAAASSSTSVAAVVNTVTVPVVADLLAVSIGNEPPSKARRLEGDNPAVRETIESDKLTAAVTYIEELQHQREISHDAVYKKFNYPACYDVEFLVSLASALSIDISSALKKKRTPAKDVLEALIAKLLS
jgi:hypothetical protein